VLRTRSQRGFGVPEIQGVSHVITHYVPGQGIHLKVDIMCDEDIAIRQASVVARRAKAVLEQIEGITAADVDLELQD